MFIFYLEASDNSARKPTTFPLCGIVTLQIKMCRVGEGIRYLRKKPAFMRDPLNT